MKNTILGIVGIFITIYTIAISMELYNLQVRKNQLDNSVSRIVQKTLEDYYQGDNIQAKQALERGIYESLHPSAKIELEILALDMEKGIISIVVTEEYRQMNGKIRTEGINKTAIMERDVEDNYQTYIE